MTMPIGIKINAPMHAGYEEILTPEALMFIAKMHRLFEPRRRYSLQARIDYQNKIDQGHQPGLLSETARIRGSEWEISPLPKVLEKRRVEITGPVERKMIINALNSGADSFMADFEDSNSPSWENQIQGQINIRDAIHRTIDFEQNGKQYQLNDDIATLQIRPRGWHLEEKHVTVDNQRVSGGLFDFGLTFFHNAEMLIKQGSGPFYYLPKLENHQEARLWNDVFIWAQNELDIPQGTIKATVLIETVLAVFELEEILYELREHSAGLNAGRWDYIFSCIKKFKNQEDFCLADRGQITMEVPFMRSYALSLIKACHKRGAPAIGGMSALIPIKNNPEANEKALAGVRHDKRRDAQDGFDGGWVAHPGLVSIAREEFDRVLSAAPNQWYKQVEVLFGPEQWLDFKPETPITLAGLKNNISVGIQYLGSWLNGNGCVPIDNLMEDAATAEICRSQVWQWIRSPKGVLEDGQKVTVDLVIDLTEKGLSEIKANNQLSEGQLACLDKAAATFKEMSMATTFPEFLTLPLYDEMP